MEVFIIFLSSLSAMVLAGETFHKVRKLYMVKATPRTPIANVKEGFTEITGKIVAALPTRTSPLSHKETVFCHIVIEGWRDEGLHERWTVLHEALLGGRFLVDDGTGVAEVDITKAERDFQVDNHRSCSFYKNAEPDFEEMLNYFGMPAKGLTGQDYKDYRCTETALEEGDTFCLLGEAQMSEARPLFNGDDGRMFYVSDKDEKGLINKLFKESIIRGGATLLLTAIAAVFHFYLR